MQSSRDQNFLNSDPPHLEPKSEEMEIKLCVFYANMLKWIYRLSDLKFDKIRKSLQNIRSYRNPDVEVHEIAEFGQRYYRFAYIFAYGIIHSIIVYDRFSGMLNNNPTLLKKIACMKRVRLCILGGGPAFEAVSICNLLSKILVQFGPVVHSPLQVYVTVIDICAGWKIEAKHIVNSVLNELSEKNIQLEFIFIEADISKDFSPDLRKAIQKAHFVTMIKCLSEICETYTKLEMSSTIHRIIESMSFKSCLFFLDNSGGGVFKQIDRMIDGFSCTFRIYGPCLHNCHKLSLDTVERFFIAMRCIFRTLRCTNQTTVSSSAWLKVRDTVEVDELVSGIANAPVKILHDPDKLDLQGRRRKVKIKKMLQFPAILKELVDVNQSPVVHSESD